MRFQITQYLIITDNNRSGHTHTNSQSKPKQEPKHDATRSGVASAPLGSYNTNASTPLVGAEDARKRQRRSLHGVTPYAYLALIGATLPYNSEYWSAATTLAP